MVLWEKGFDFTVVAITVSGLHLKKHVYFGEKKVMTKTL